jgi:hypothetical protein
MSNPLSLFADGLLMIVVLFYTFWQRDAVASFGAKNRLDYLMEREDQLFENLRDVTFEYLTGMYMEESFVAYQALLEEEAERLLVEMIELQRE